MIRDECKLIIMNLGEDKEVRQGFIELFEAFSADPAAQELPAITYVLPCYDENTKFEAGDWAPEIHLVLRKVADEFTSDGGEQTDQVASEEGEPGPAA